MAGILLLIIFSAYLMLAFWLMDKAKTFRKKGLILILLILIPTADEIYYSYKLSNLCQSEAGLRVNTPIPHTAGIYFGHWSAELYFKKLNLNLVEWNVGRKQELNRLSRDSSGEIKREQIKDITSQYLYSYNREMLYPFLYTAVRLTNIESKAVASEFKNVVYYGGWFRQKLLGSLADSGPTMVKDCGFDKNSTPTLELLKNGIKSI